MKFYNLGDKTFETDFRYSANGYWQYWGGSSGVLNFCLRFPCKVKVFKIKSSSWTIFFTPLERAIKTEKNDTFPVHRWQMSRKIQSLKEKAYCTCAVHRMPLRTLTLNFHNSISKKCEVFCNVSFCFLLCALYFHVFIFAYLVFLVIFFLPRKDMKASMHTWFKDAVSRFLQEFSFALYHI